MRYHLLDASAGVLLTTIWLVNSSLVRGEDWMTWPSTYTHSPETGLRVDQFAVGQQPLAPNRSDFVRSGYRHFRSTLQAGQSADNLHIVEQWGRPVIPYEQWRFPFRPYGVPYDAWGPQAPYGITNGYFGFGGTPGFGAGGYGYGAYAGGGQGGTGWAKPATGQPGVPGMPSPGWSHPGSDPAGPSQLPWYGPWSPRLQQIPPARGFPLTPTYNGEPWYDGTYPSAPPLGR